MKRTHLTALPILSLICAILAPVSTTSAAETGETIRRYELERAEQGYRLALRSVARPSPGRDDVVVRVRAVSLNHRDLYILQGAYGGDASGRVPVSDGAGEVVAVGPGVRRFKVGDRVATTFFENWNSGPPTRAAIAMARGGAAPGVLSEDGLVRIPDHLSFDEAATLPCAAVTAWNGLFKHGRLRRGQFVLLEGTGGCFDLRLAIRIGGGRQACP